MSDIPETRQSLLIRLKDPQDREAWDQFSALYRPVIYRLARGRGLQDADAQDLSQQVLMAVAGAIPRWQRAGQEVRFRHWLRRITRNATINALSRRPQDLASGGSTMMNLLQQSPEQDQALEEAIDWEHRREVYRQAAQQLRQESSDEMWQVFSLTVLDGQSSQQAARALKKSLGAIYVARSRIMARLRELVRGIDEEAV